MNIIIVIIIIIINVQNIENRRSISFLGEGWGRTAFMYLFLVFSGRTLERMYLLEGTGV